jgi:hypothetical protein
MFLHPLETSVAEDGVGITDAPTRGVGTSRNFP